MKHLLLISASLCCTNLMAADVTLYGHLNTSLNYAHADIGGKTVDRLSMDSGNNFPSLFGLEGSEEIAPGVRAGFVLESQFNSDDGSLQFADTLFSRESTVFIASDLGELRFGKMGAVRSPVSNAKRFGGDVSPIGMSWGNTYIQATGFVNSATPVRPNNAVLYTSPEIAGFDVTLQYSLADNTEGRTADSDNRYMAAVLRYQNGPLKSTLLVDTTNLSQATDNEKDDPFSVGFALNYDFTDFKLWGVAQYFQDSELNHPTGFINTHRTYDGYGLMLAASAPAAGGTVKTMAGFMDAQDAEDKSGDIIRYNAALTYEYPLSRRTIAYTGLGYVHQKVDKASELDADGFEWETGLLHFF